LLILFVFVCWWVMNELILILFVEWVDTMSGFWFCLWVISIWNLDYVICVDFDNLSW
jgi:hypothetical protein